MAQPISRDTAPLPARPRLALFDIDGTLINSGHRIGDRTRAAVRRLQNAGTPCAFVTGRPCFSTVDLAQSLEISTSGVYFSGALLTSPDGRLVLEQTTLGKPELLQILSLASRQDFYLELYDSTQYYSRSINELAQIHAGYLGKPPVISNLDELAASAEIIKAEAVLTASNCERVLSELAAIPGVTISAATGAAHPELTFVNITAATATRKNGVSKLLTLLGLSSRNVICFGDSGADVEVFQSCGCSVAMGNAPEWVKAQATYVTSTVDEDGVALALQQLLP